MKIHELVLLHDSLRGIVARLTVERVQLVTPLLMIIVIFYACICTSLMTESCSYFCVPCASGYVTTVCIKRACWLSKQRQHLMSCFGC